MDENFSDLQKLLRLKKYETPSPEYFEGFLKDFHRRQRQEIVNLPIWRIAWDRVTASFVPGEVPRFAYATACAAVLFVTVLASRQMVSRPAGSDLAAVTPAVSASRFESSPVRMTLNQKPQSFLNGAGFASARDSRSRGAGSLAGEPSRSTRYVLDARPVSYEAPVSF
jgi:hypothetical protein